MSEALDFPRPRYRVGDSVFAPVVTSDLVELPCPDCLGTKRWKCTTPAGREVEVVCPGCAGAAGARPLRRLSFTPKTRRLTIGSVKIDSASEDRPVEYMAYETGIGSGTIWPERDLFVAEAAALEAARTRAQESQIRHEAQPGVVLALQLAAYQLVDARLEEERAKRIWLGYRLRDLLDALQEALDNTPPAELPARVAELVKDPEDG